MKPPYLKKLSKKQLKKEYTRQWREAIRANGEIYKANQINDQLHEFIRTQAEEIEVKSIALTEHFGEIQNLKQLLDHERRERIRVELQAVDLEEALSRSRQLRQSFQEVADRKTWEKVSIEAMAENLYYYLQEKATDVVKEQFGLIGLSFNAEMKKYSDLTEDQKDIFRVKVTHIISHQPTDGKPEGTTLDEGSAG